MGLAFDTSASATVYQYNFGEKISGTRPSEVDFANLSFDDTSSMFTLSLSTQFATIFKTAIAFVGSMAVGYEGEGEGAYPVFTGVVAGGGVKLSLQAMVAALVAPLIFVMCLAVDQIN